MPIKSHSRAIVSALVASERTWLKLTGAVVPELRVAPVLVVYSPRMPGLKKLSGENWNVAEPRRAGVLPWNSS